jgi:hypothetical protein
MATRTTALPEATLVELLGHDADGHTSRATVANVLADLSADVADLTANLALFQRLEPPDATFDDAPFEVLKVPGGYQSSYPWDTVPATITGTTYYVDGASGSDANNGTSVTTPLLNLKTAISKVDVGIIYIKGGTYNRGTGSGNGWLLDSSYTWPSRNMALIGWGGDVTIWDATAGNGLSWSDQGSGAFSTTLANVFWVFDTSLTDPLVSTLPRQLTSRADLAAVQAADEGWAVSGSTLYVKRDDEASPGATTMCARIAGWPAVKSPVLYMRNIRVLGSATGFRPNSTAYNQDAKFIAINCTFAYSRAATDSDALGVTNIGFCGLKNCQGYYGGKDVLNYHCALADTGDDPLVLEEGCTAKYSAWNRAEKRGPYQASTVHDGYGCTRINGTYGPTLAGPCIQEDSSAAFRNTMGWIIGGTVDATGSPSGSGAEGGPWDFALLGGTNTECWCDTVVFVAGTHSVKGTTGTGPVYLRDCTVPTMTGNVGPY